MEREDQHISFLGVMGRMVLVSALAELASLAFSRPVKKEIKERDGRECTGEGFHAGILEAAHIDHSHANPLYNDPSNGKLLCTAHHLEDHVLRAGQNGLTTAENDGAITTVAKRLGAIIRGS